MDVIKRKSDTLASIEKKQQGAAVALLSNLVANLCDAFNVGKNMDGTQCMETAIGILEDFPQFSADDIALCFNKAKKGVYGKVFDRMDSATIFGFLEQYYEAKLEALEQYHRSLATTYDGDNQEETPEQKRIFAENIAKVKQLLNSKKEPPKPEPTVGAVADRYQRWMTQFDQLYTRNGKRTAGMKFIYRYGKWLDVSGYLQHKETQFNQFS